MNELIRVVKQTTTVCEYLLETFLLTAQQSIRSTHALGPVYLHIRVERVLRKSCYKRMPRSHRETCIQTIHTTTTAVNLSTSVTSFS